MSEQKSSMEKCPTCGMTVIKYDPPLEFKVTEACGAMKPGNWATKLPIPICMLERGHEGPHWDAIDYEVRWSDDGTLIL